MELNFKRNLSNTDRLIRFLIGIVLLALAFTRVITGWWANLAIVIAVFQFIEAFFAY